jgi:hypothetical protein
VRYVARNTRIVRVGGAVVNGKVSTLQGSAPSTVSTFGLNTLINALADELLPRCMNDTRTHGYCFAHCNGYSRKALSFARIGSSRSH